MLNYYAWGVIADGGGEGAHARGTDQVRRASSQQAHRIGGQKGSAAGRPSGPEKVHAGDSAAGQVNAAGQGNAAGPRVHIGGEEVQHALMSRYLARKGFAVTSLVGDFGQRPLERIEGVDVRKTFALGDGIPGLRFFTPRVTSTWKALKAADADIYYVSCAGAMVGVIAAFCRRYQRRFVFRVASDADCSPRTLMVGNPRDRMLYHYGLRRADAVLVQTEKQAELLLRNYGVHATVAGMFSDLPATVLPFDQRGADMLWLANMRSMKRPEWFTDMVRLAPELRCVMAGGAHPDELALYARVSDAAEQLPNLRFHGQVRFAATRSLFAAARVFVNTSSFEGFPNTYLQAWANGVPVVATFDPDGIIAAHGLGVAVASPAEAVAAVRTLLASPAGWAACSARCRAYALARLSPDTVSIPYLAALAPSLGQRMMPAAEPVAHPATPAVNQSNGDPVTDPGADPVTDPRIDPVTDPKIDPVTDPIIDPVVDPVIDPVIDPVPAEGPEVNPGNPLSGAPPGTFVSHAVAAAARAGGPIRGAAT